MYSILIIDDDIGMLEMLADVFESENYEVRTLSNPEEFILEDADLYDLIILDIMMPEVDGIQLCKSMRKHTTHPIIFLTAKFDEDDIIEGLTIGADDYIIKPFSIKTLLARVEAHLRREFQFENRKNFEISGLTFKIQEKCVFYKNQIINLTKKEYDLCLLLATHKTRIFTKEEIYTMFYNDESDVQFRIITQYIYQIRKKFMEYGIDPIRGVWGAGYQWKN